MKSRKELLEELLSFDGPLEPILKELSEYEWDTDEPILRVTPYHLSRLFIRYLNGELTNEDLETWAEAIECRDDLECQDFTSPSITDIVNAHANQGLEGRIDNEMIETWLIVLERNN